MRDAFGAALCDLASQRNFVVVDADNAPATRTAAFARAFPDRAVNVGCAEQNMVGFSTGLALTGQPVVASTFAVFLCGRAYEQIRSACRARLPITLVGTHAGVTVGRDGASHFAVEDIAMMRALPEMCVLVASADEQVAGLVRLALDASRPVYLRISRRPTPARWTVGQPRLGGAERLVGGDELSILACGVMVERSLQAAKLLEAQGVRADVIDVYSVKPLAETLIVDSVRETGAVVVVEEHSRHGGLGDTVANLLARVAPTPMEHVAIADAFGRSGDPDELLDLLGLSVRSIVEAGLRARNRRGRS
jgi:transketolase